MNGLVSILIPNFNKSLYLRESLDSVLAQTYTHWECIVVDDHSTDTSCEIIEEYVAKDSRFKLFKRPVNRKPGGNAARNFAFEMSKGEFINWLDSDDIFFKEKIEKQVLCFANFNNDFVLSQFKNDNPTSKIFIFEKNVCLRPIKYIKKEFWFQTGIPLFRRNFLLSIGTLFNEDLKRGQEEEFFVRILIKKPKIFFLEETLIHLRKDPNSITHSFEKKSETEKANSDAIRFLHLHHLLKNNEFLNEESSRFFVKKFIYFIQYSSLKNKFQFKFLMICLIYGDTSNKILALKSFLSKVMIGN